MQEYVLLHSSSSDSIGHGKPCLSELYTYQDSGMRMLLPHAQPCMLACQWTAQPFPIAQYAMTGMCFCRALGEYCELEEHRECGETPSTLAQ